jgi:uncharacterized protein YjiS (DUF1127 family)
MTLFQRFQHWRAARRAERQVLSELACYTDRELHELGIARGDVAALARDAFDQAWAESVRAQARTAVHGGHFWTARHA